MDTKWQRVREIFNAALGRPLEERSEYVIARCGGDETLLKEVQSLLASLDSSESFLETPVVANVAKLAEPNGLKLENGSRLAHYEIIRQIGEGGMGVVYLGRDLTLERLVAIKLLSKRYGSDEDSIRRFVREARSASALNHPNILTIFEIGEFEGTHFIVSEYIEGRTLREIIKGAKLELRTVVDITAQIANALAAAHKARIVHRDIKPENIIVREDGYVKVLDFGLAKLLAENISGVLDKESARTHNSTASGMILGTVNYMSPEQARAASIDHRTDIFSLGVVLYEMITGFGPFKADTPADTIAAVIQREPPPPGRTRNDVPKELDDIVAKMVEKDRAARYQSATDLLTDLGQLKRRLEFETELERTSQPSSLPAEAETQFLDSAGTKNIPGRRTLHSIAVLPFVNTSADPENEYFCDGLAEELLNALTKVENLKVAARTSAFTFKNRNIEISEIGRALNVSTVLEGSVRKSGNKLRITVQLVNATDGFHLWSERFDREMKDIFDIQDQITLAVVSALKVELLGEEKAAILKRYSDNAEAYELYLKGLYHSYKWTGASFLKSFEYFKKSLEIDPGFAPAYAKIADYYHFHSFVGGLSPVEVIGEWRTAAQRALELDETLSEAHVAMGHIYFHHDRNWQKAEQEFRRAIALNPNDPRAHMHYGLFLVSRERFDEAVASVKKALSLDPLSVAVNFVAAQTYFYAHRSEDSLELVRMMRELDPNAPQSFWQEGKLLLADGRYEEAVEVLEKASALGDNQMALSMRGCAYGLAGHHEEAQSILDELFETRKRSYAAAFNIARVYAGLGDRDKAFEWLEKAADERNAEMVHLKRKVEAGKGLYFGNNLSSDSRYKEILRETGLPIEPGAESKHRSTQISEIGTTQKGDTSDVARHTNEQLHNTSSEKRELKWWPFGLLAMIALAGLYLGYQYLAPSGRQIESIAVMPFLNEGGDPQVEYLSDGMTDTLISSLSELPNLKVKARTSVFRYKGKEIDPKAIGRELGVQAILNGRVAQRDGRTSVMLELVDTETEDVIFTTKYDKPQSELVTLQSDIARYVSGKLKSKLSGAEEAKVTKAHTADPAALQLYLQGQFYRHKGGRGNVLQAADYFNKAIEKDPNYALAYAGLALNYSSYDLYNLVPDWTKAREAGKRALELDDSLAESHLATGDFRRAIELNPDYADAHVGLCIDLTMRKRFDEGITECRKAHELDPLSVLVTMRLGAAYFFARRPDEAIEVLTVAHEMDPTLWVPIGYLGGAQTLKGQYSEAAATFRKAIEISDGSPNTKSHLAYALAKAGKRDEALKLVAELKRQAEHEHINSFHFAVPYIGLGDKDEAFFWLGKGIDERSLGFRMLDVHPWFDELRSDPRFTALLNRIKPEGS